MTEEKELELFKYYPNALAHYGEKRAGLSRIWCDDGWYDLIDSLCEQLELLDNAFGVNVRITQIKEKYGLLRVYTSVRGKYDDNSRLERLVRDIVSACCHKTEELSRNICELTGDTAGTLCQYRGHYKTLSYESSRGNLKYKNFNPISNSVCEYWYELDKQKLNG